MTRFKPLSSEELAHAARCLDRAAQLTHRCDSAEPYDVEAMIRAVAMPTRHGRLHNGLVSDEMADALATLRAMMP